MAVVNLKSTPVTNLDATPRVSNTTAEGSFGYSKRNEGYSTAPASASTTSTFQLVRVPSNAKIKAVDFESAAQGAGKFSIGVYYATDNSNQTYGTTLPPTAVNSKTTLFASQIDASSAVGITNVTNQSGNYTIDKRTQPLWQACGLTVDPKCNFDIVATVDTTAVTTGTGLFGISVTYVL